MLLKQIPDIELIIGGGICSHLEGKIRTKNILLKGKFENPAGFYALGDIVIKDVSW